MVGKFEIVDDAEGPHRCIKCGVEIPEEYMGYHMGAHTAVLCHPDREHQPRAPAAVFLCAALGARSPSVVLYGRSG